MILQQVCDPKKACWRKFMARSHVYFLEVPPRTERQKGMGAMLKSDIFPEGKMGVRGFLYFSFSLPDRSGAVSHPEGYARVREYGNPDDADNPTLVWTWRKKLAAKMCQTCSDREGRIVDLSENSCTKRFCEKKLAEDAENAENADDADDADDAEEAKCDYAGRNDEPDEPEPDVLKSMGGKFATFKLTKLL